MVICRLEMCGTNSGPGNRIGNISVAEKRNKVSNTAFCIEMFSVQHETIVKTE